MVVQMAICRESPKARNGESNGRSKLRDGEVRLLRLARINRQVSYRDLASAFDLTPRHAKRLCMGLLRESAGGPIESADSQREDRQSVVPALVDGSRIQRCGRCGNRAYPAIERPEWCLHCVMEVQVEQQRATDRMSLRGPSRIA